MLTRLDQVPLASDEVARLAPVAEQYRFRLNSYYSELIDWQDPHDPLRRLIVPEADELLEWGELDTSDETGDTRVPGLQHKYADTALLLCSNSCAAYCRYCFRKRLFTDSNTEVPQDLSAAYEYIAHHPEITNVLLTGGDPLFLSTSHVAEILRRLRQIDHVRIIRIGSKVPAFDPGRITGDSDLLGVLRANSSRDRRIYLMTHFDHPREITSAALAAMDSVLSAGVACANQCPIIRGVNDQPQTLSRLFHELSCAACPQYYVFQCRPTAGNRGYSLPIVRSWSIFQDALNEGAGLSSRARFVVSHSLGKSEILWVSPSRIRTRYHQARDRRDRGRFVNYVRDDDAIAIDELVSAEDA